MATPQLQAAIETVYRVLRTPMPRSIEGCPCCSDPKALCRLLEKRLSDLSPADLSDYAMSVFWTVDESGFRYFLPRLLEILATERDWWPSPPIILKKLVLAGWRNWAPKERDAIEHLVRTWLDTLLREEPVDGDAIDAVICGIGLAHIPLAPYLEMLAAQPKALASYYEDNSYTLWKNKKLSNGFWSEDRALSAPIIEFLMSDRVQELLKRMASNND